MATDYLDDEEVTVTTPAADGSDDNSWGDVTSTGSGVTIDVNDANAVAELLRSSDSSSSSSSTSSSSISDNTYSSAYADQISSVLSSLLSSSYDDWLLSDEYASLSDTYTANGESAMLDTLGQVASRTGGMASSYAGTAAQQTYNSYMDGLDTAAQSAYSDYNDSLYDQLALLMSLDDSEYDRYRDTVSDSMYDQEFDYTSSQDSLSQSNYETEWDYDVSQDSLSQSNYETEWDYEMTQDEYDQALTKAQTLAAYGDFSGYSALGYSDEEVAAMEAAYEAEQVINTVYVSSGSSSDDAVDVEDDAETATSVEKSAGYDAVYSDARMMLQAGGTASYENIYKLITTAYSNGEITESEIDRLLNSLGM